MNLWRQVRFGGGAMMLAGSLMNNVMLTLVGIVFLGTGTVNGLLVVERKIEELEKLYAENKTKENND